MNNIAYAIGVFTAYAGLGSAVRIEEDDPGFCGGDGRIRLNALANLTGAGYFDTQNFLDATMEWVVDGSAGSYTFTWLHTGGPGDEPNRRATLYIDGLAIREVDFFNTTLEGAPPNYTPNSVTVDGVPAGLKNIQLSADTEFGLASIDWMEVDGVDDITAPDCCASTPEVDLNSYLSSLDMDIPSFHEPDGWASVYGVTGGGSKRPQVVNTLRELRNALRGQCPTVAVLNATVDTLDTLTLGSNKTLIGAGTRGRFVNQKLEIRDTSNIIIQNVDFSVSTDDMVEVRTSEGVFISQCSFHDSSDELLSVVRGSDYVTVAHSHFYFVNVDEHAYAHLVGHSDSNGDQDRGRLHVTFHDNFYDDGVQERQPRVRFGQVHVYNSYFSSDATTAVFGFGAEAQIRVENVFINNQTNVIDDRGGAELGAMGWRNMLSVTSEIIPLAPNTFPVFDVPYDFVLKETSMLDEVAPLCAGVGQYETDNCRAATRLSTIGSSPASSLDPLSLATAALVAALMTYLN